MRTPHTTAVLPDAGPGDTASREFALAKCEGCAAPAAMRCCSASRVQRPPTALRLERMRVDYGPLGKVKVKDCRRATWNRIRYRIQYCIRAGTGPAPRACRLLSKRSHPPPQLSLDSPMHFSLLPALPLKARSYLGTFQTSSRTTAFISLLFASVAFAQESKPKEDIVTLEKFVARADDRYD